MAKSPITIDCILHILVAQKMVREFHQATGCLVCDKPTFPDLATRKLRHRLIAEELEELLTSEAKRDLTEVADALGDLLYVVLGTCVSYGIDIEPVFNEIHRSNMTKTKDGYLREDGKYMKGPSYEPPEIAPIILKQIMNNQSKSAPYIIP